MTLRQAQGERAFDRGLADPEAAMLAIRRAKLRLKLRDAQSLLASALDELNVISQPDRDPAPRALFERCELAARRRERNPGQIGVFDADSQRVREREMLDGLDAVLEFLELVNSDLGHGLFSLVKHGKPTEPKHPAHRLSGDAK